MATRIPILFDIASLCVLPMLQAQPSSCGISSIIEGKPLLYPAIAKAAHVEGVVVALVTFDHDGQPSDAHIASGLKMLQGVTLDYVKALRANAYAGSRQCPMMEVFRQPKTKPVRCGTSPPPDQTAEHPPYFRRIDLQYVEITYQQLCYVEMASAQ